MYLNLKIRSKKKESGKKIEAFQWFVGPLFLIFRKIDFKSRMKNQSTGNVYLMQWHINLDFAFAALENFRNVKIE